MSPVSNSFSSPFHGPHMAKTNPITGKPWTAQELQTVQTLDSTTDAFYNAIKQEDQVAAQAALAKRDQILGDMADPGVKAAFSILALSQLSENVVEGYTD
jgi:hypothetical protein